MKDDDDDSEASDKEAGLSDGARSEDDHFGAGSQDSDDDLLRPVKRKSAAEDDGDEQEEGQDADMFNLPKLSKNAMRKIKTDGAYEGKNKIIFGADGKIIRGDDHDKSEYMSKLRKESEKGGKTVGLVDEDDVSDGDAQDTYIKRVK